MALTGAARSGNHGTSAPCPALTSFVIDQNVTVAFRERSRRWVDAHMPYPAIIIDRHEKLSPPTPGSGY